MLDHLDELAMYLERTQQPGIMLSPGLRCKAFDRLDRHCIERCMAAVGFRPGLLRRVRLLLSGTTACVARNGWHDPVIPCQLVRFLQGSLPVTPAVRTGHAHAAGFMPLCWQR